MLEEHVSEVNNDWNNELNKLIELMSNLYIDHQATIALCYAQYFQQKVNEFEEIEKLIRLLIRSFKSNSNDFKNTTLPLDVNKLREECLFFAGYNFKYIETQGFGSKRSCKSGNKTVVPTTSNPCKSSNESDLRTITKAETKSTTWNGDHFCNFILKTDKCDNGTKMVGYGMIKSDASPVVKSSNAPKIEKSKLATAIINATKSSKSSTIVQIPKKDKLGATSSSDFPVASCSTSNMTEASKIKKSNPAIKATTSSGKFKQSPKKIDKSNIVRPADVQGPVAVANTLMINEPRTGGGVVPIEVDSENYENIPLENFKFPARLRMKRNLEVMTRTDNLQNVQVPEPDPTESKRRRDL